MSKIFILGGVSIDLMGVSCDPLVMKDSNPGSVSLSFGGVGRNIAENCAHLGADVELISVFGDDHLGHLCYKDCVESKIKVDHSIFSDHASSMYLAILDPKGDLSLGLSDNSILSTLNYDAIRNALSTISSQDILVLETNLEKELIDTVLTHKPCMIACDPISTHKAEKLINHLDKIDIFKPNNLEAEVYFGSPLQSDKDFLEALRFFRNKGVHEIIISAAENGIYVSKDEDYFRLLTPSISVVNATGAGDAFMGAYLVMRQRFDFQKALELACCASLLTLESPMTVNKDLNLETIVKKHTQCVFVRKELC
jgi:pseudouridine kinase